MGYLNVAGPAHPDGGNTGFSAVHELAWRLFWGEMGLFLHSAASASSGVFGASRSPKKQGQGHGNHGMMGLEGTAGPAGCPQMQGKGHSQGWKGSPLDLPKSKEKDTGIME